jgi:hypothetical protein
MTEPAKSKSGGCGGCLGAIVVVGFIVVVVAALAGGGSSSSTPAATPEPAPATTETETQPAPAATEGGAEDEGTSESSGEEDEVGSSSHAGDTKFCEEHTCEGDFTGEDGTVVECSDGTYSHAGGISGACSDHGGEAEKKE